MRFELNFLGAARAFLLLGAVGSFTSPPIANVAEFLALACLAFVPGMGRRLRAIWALPAARALLAFLGIMAISMTWAAAPWRERFGELWTWRAFLLMPAGWLAFSGDTAAQARFARILAGVLVFCSIVSFVCWTWPQLLVLPDHEPGVLLRNHVTQGMAMVTGIVLLVGLAVGRATALAPRGMLAVGAALLLANIALVCLGRSSHVALVVASTALALLLAPPAWRLRAALGCALASVAVLAASPMVRDRFHVAADELRTADDEPVPTSSESSMGLRLAIWRRTAGIIADHPLLGVGAGGFATEYAARIPPEASGSQAARARDTHNQYLRVQVEAGLPGSVAFLLMIGLLLRQAGAAPWRAAGVSLLCAWLATSLFNSHFENFDVAHLIGVLLGVLLAPAAVQASDGSAALARAA